MADPTPCPACRGRGTLDCQRCVVDEGCARGVVYVGGWSSKRGPEARPCSCLCHARKPPPAPGGEEGGR